MPVLDARALKTDPKGVAFLRDVLSRASSNPDQDRAPKVLLPFRLATRTRMLSDESARSA
jgi:hypothetical protein